MVGVNREDGPHDVPVPVRGLWHKSPMRASAVFLLSLGAGLAGCRAAEPDWARLPASSVGGVYSSL